MQIFRILSFLCYFLLSRSKYVHDYGGFSQLGFIRYKICGYLEIKHCSVSIRHFTE